MNHLLIFSDEADEYLAVLQRLNLPDLHGVAVDNLAEARQQCTSANILLGEPHRIRLILAEATALEWVQSNYVGVGPLLDEACRKDYLLTHLGGLYGPVMTEYVFCYLLMHERRALERYLSQPTGCWDPTITGSLQGKVLGLNGVGAMGARIAQTAKHFGMRTWGYTRSSRGCEYIDAYYHGDQLLEFVSGADYVVCTLPDTPETLHLIDHTVLAAMPRHAVLVNVGRGSVIDEEALVRALQQGTIAGAVLDVFEEEPLPPSHPLWTAPNVYITCHTAAPGPNYYEEIVGIFGENYHRFIAGAPLKNLVDFERGY